MVFGRGDFNQVRDNFHNGYVVQYGTAYHYDKMYDLGRDYNNYSMYGLHPIHMGYVMQIYMGQYCMFKTCTEYEKRRFDTWNWGIDRKESKIMKRVKSFDEFEGEEWLNKFMDKHARDDKSDKWWQKQMEWRETHEELDKKRSLFAMEKS
jgi:hypothetical protein